VKSISWTGYGSPEVLLIREIEKPVPEDHEILVRIHSASVTMGDCEMRAMKLPLFIRFPMRAFVGLFKPKRISTLGMELSGTVESTGKSVERFKAGDEILASTGARFGAYCECICLPEEAGEMDGPVALKPQSLSFDEAAVIPNGGLEALHFLKQAGVSKGTEILINGAGGSIGTFAVQLAKLSGAIVTAVDSSDKLEMLKAIGSDHIIDFTKENFAASGKKYDVIFDVVGKVPLLRGLKALRNKGRLLVANPTLFKLTSKYWISLLSGRKLIIGAGSQKVEDLVHLTGLVEKGEIKSIIDKIYSLEQIREAHEYVESGEKTGHVVIRI